MNRSRIAALSLLVLVACGQDDADPGAITGDGSSSGSTASGGQATSSSGGAGSSGGHATSSGGAAGTSGSSGSTSSGGVAGSSCKRGVAYGHHSEADLRALQPGVSWWYNWAFTPDDGVRDVYTQIGVQYVPMIWGGGVDLAQATTQIPAGSGALLGFNEPNFGEQANLSAQAAASRWPGLQAIADAKNLPLVSPAVNFCGGNCQDTDPFAYLDDFFAACTDCRVDAIAAHVYVGCAGTAEHHAQWLIDHVKTYEERFDKPIWLTEFACDDAADEATQQAFLVDAVDYLERDPRVQRYAWFAGRADNVRHVDLLGADGQLTALGHAYVEAPAACDP